MLRELEIVEVATRVNPVSKPYLLESNVSTLHILAKFELVAEAEEIGVSVETDT